MLTPITPVAEELRREEAMGAIARAHAAGAEAGNWLTAPLIGGTALRIIHGVPRPSLDLDFVVLQPDRQLTRDELTVCAEQAGYRTVQCGLAENQRQRQLVIREPGWLGKKIRILVDETAAQAHERKYLVAALQGGILSYEPADLFRLKTGALVTPPRPGLRPRVAARDVFDTAFILERFPAALDDSRILDIAKVARGYRTGTTREVWQSAFSDDEIMRRADCDSVWNALEQAIARPLDQARQRRERQRTIGHGQQGSSSPEQANPVRKPTATEAQPGGAKRRRKDGIGY